MTLRFYHDVDTNLPHIYNHGVTEEEVEDVLRRPMEEAKTGGGSRIAIGQTRTGRYSRSFMFPTSSAMASSSSRRMICAGKH